MNDRSDTDQLERDVEAALARLATNAVPDTERPPAPPWQGRRHTVDARRFGRATPWLIAAVLLVIAGLGVGAAVTFDASGPDRRGPVGTELPSPTATVTTSDGTLGTPVSTPTTTPASTPTLSRNGNTAPSDGLGTFTAGIGSFGPVRAGMTLAEAQAALGLDAGETVAGYGSTCKVAVPMPGDGGGNGTPKAIVDDAAGATVVGFDTAVDTVDGFGNGIGTTLAQLRVSYPGGELDYGQAGWTFTVLGSGDTGLGFRLTSDAPQDQQPAASSEVSALLPGSADYARGYELCVG